MDLRQKLMVISAAASDGHITIKTQAAEAMANIGETEKNFIAGTQEVPYSAASAFLYYFPGRRLWKLWHLPRPIIHDGEKQSLSELLLQSNVKLIKTDNLLSER